MEFVNLTFEQQRAKLRAIRNALTKLTAITDSVGAIKIGLETSALTYSAPTKAQIETEQEALLEAAVTEFEELIS